MRLVSERRRGRRCVVTVVRVRGRGRESTRVRLGGTWRRYSRLTGRRHGRWCTSRLDRLFRSVVCRELLFLLCGRPRRSGIDRRSGYWVRRRSEIFFLGCQDRVILREEPSIFSSTSRCSLRFLFCCRFVAIRGRSYGVVRLRSRGRRSRARFLRQMRSRRRRVRLGNLTASQTFLVERLRIIRPRGRVLLA